MIKVLIKHEGNKFLSLEVKGHANSAPHGEDLVCAGVSAILTGGFNSLENIENFKYELKEGYAFLEKKNDISFHDEIVIETIITSLETVKESYEKFIQIQRI